MSNDMSGLTKWSCWVKTRPTFALRFELIEWSRLRRSIKFGGVVKSEDLFDRFKAGAIGHAYYVTGACRAVIPHRMARPTSPLRDK